MCMWQITFDLIWFDLAYACPYHNHTATIGHSVHNVDISKSIAHTTPKMMSAICPIQLKLGFIREYLHTEDGYEAELRSGQNPGEDDEQADELPWDGFWQFVQKWFVYANPVSLAVRVSGLKTIPQVKKPDVEVLGWCGYTLSAVVSLVGCTE